MTTRYELECGIIGGMLLNPLAVGDVTYQLSSADFESKVTRTLYEGIVSLSIARQPVDKISLLLKVGEDYVPAVQDCLQVAVLHPVKYCPMLKEQSKLSRMHELADKLRDAEDLATADRALAQLNRCAVDRKTVSLWSADDAVDDFAQRMAAVEAPKYLKFGIDGLDKTLYAEPGDFIVLGGYPSAGKTLLSLQFAAHQAKQHRVGYFSLETSRRKVTDRLMAHMAQVSMAGIKTRRLGLDERGRIRQAGEAVRGLKLTIVEAAGMSVHDIQSIALAEKLEIIYIDYLQLIASGAKDRYEAVTQISMDLHRMAQTCGITVIALAQLRRPEQVKGKPQPPGMSSLRESGQIEQDADIVMLLWPEDLNDNRSARVLKVGKNKEGEKAKMSLAFDGARQTFRPIEPSAYQQMQEGLRKISAAEKEKQAGQQMSLSLAGDPPFPF